jgi:hypothetical protein
MGSVVDRLYSMFGTPAINMMAARPVVYRQRGYQTGGGREYSTDGVFQRKSIVMGTPTETGFKESKGATLTIARSKVIDNGREPRRGDEFLVDGERYIVNDVAADGEDWFLLTGLLETPTETSGGGESAGGHGLMPVAPEGIFSTLPFAFAQALANCSSFQSKVGAVTADAALVRIPVLINVPPPLNPNDDEPVIEDVPRPRAIVCEPRRMTFGRSGFIVAADLVVVYELDIALENQKNENSTEGADPQGVITEMLNWAGNCTKELMLLGESGGGWVFIHGGEKMDYVDRVPIGNERDYQRLLVSYTCGIRGASR